MINFLFSNDSYQLKVKSVRNPIFHVQTLYLKSFMLFYYIMVCTRVPINNRDIYKKEKRPLSKSHYRFALSLHCKIELNKYIYE